MTEQEIDRATPNQCGFIYELCGDLGYDPDEYVTPTLTKKEASDLIRELIKERG